MLCFNGFAPGGFADARLSGSWAFTDKPFCRHEPQHPGTQGTHRVQQRVRLGLKNKLRRTVPSAKEPDAFRRRPEGGSPRRELGAPT